MFDIHKPPQNDEEVYQLGQLAAKAMRQANTGQVECACCGKSLELKLLYRCYYCELWL